MEHDELVAALSARIDALTADVAILMAEREEREAALNADCEFFSEAARSAR